MPKYRSTNSALERARIAAGLTLSEVGTALTRRPESVRRYETGRTMPPQGVLLALARIYGCSPEELVD